MAAYGDGGIYLKRGIYYARLWHNGRKIRESLRTADEKLARRRLAVLRKQRDRGAYQDPTSRRATVDDLLDDLLVHLEANGAASLPRARSHLKPVREEFGHLAARALETAGVERAARAWRRAGKAPATVNRRLELLREAYNLAARRTPPKVAAVPYIPLLRVQNARQGFLSAAELGRLVKAIRNADVRDFVEWGSWTGMRPGETRKITWPMVDLQARTLALDPRAAKTRKGRVIALEGPLWDLVQRRLKRRRLGCQLVFHRDAKGMSGQPVRDIRKAFASAAKAAGIRRALLPYDLRRSALRNMIRAGTHETVAMAISGHRTRSTFDRYNITSAEDTRAAIAQTVEWAKKGGAKH